MARKILDVGCGPESKIKATHFTDMDPVHVKGRKNGRVWDPNKLSLPCKNNTFDMVYCGTVLEPLDMNTEDILPARKMPNGFILAHHNKFFTFTHSFIGKGIKIRARKVG